eukprot:jgi/Tetstr1/449049/TSEL_036264.t1
MTAASLSAGRTGPPRAVRAVLCVLVAAGIVCGAANFYHLAASINIASAQTAVEENFRSVSQLSSDGYASVATELGNLQKGVDHLYHHLTNTQDDDGHIVDLLGEEMQEMGVALQGEEPLTQLEELELQQQQQQQEGAVEAEVEVEVEEAVEQGQGQLAALSPGDSGLRGPASFDHLAPATQLRAQAGFTDRITGTLQVPKSLHFGEPGEGVLRGATWGEGASPRAGAFDSSLLAQGAAATGLQPRQPAVIRHGAGGESTAQAPGHLQHGAAGRKPGSGGGSPRGGAPHFADRWLAMKTNQTRFPHCGGMPKSFGPKFVDQPMPPLKTKAYPAKDGTVSPLSLNNRQLKVPTEHGRRPARKATNKPRLKASESALIACLNNLGKCTGASMRAALSLRGMQEALQTRKPMLKKPHVNCAVVGNSGGMMRHAFGSYIDTHDYVIRINILPTKKLEDNLGKRVDARVLSYKMAKDVCCIKKDYRADNSHLEFYIWFPASRAQVRSRMLSKLKTNPVHIMSAPFLTSAVLAFKAFRGELLRMGYGPFEDWEYMTSGMHAVLGLIRSCQNVDVYGFTTDVKATGPYWFTGRAVPPRSGQTQHAWDHERMVLRLLHAAGAVNICTS